MSSPVPERWREIRDLFEQAVEQSPADIDAWLRLHASALDVRTEVASLLDHDRRAGSFLIDPVAERVPDLLDDEGPLEAGRRVGDFVVVREIGRGGMGRVYLAHDERLGRPVALKALAPAVIADPAHRERLRREARAAASLSHPAICTVYALEQSGDDLFIASEYVDGRTLRQDIVDGRRPTASEVVGALRELGEAVACAHRNGITHRDLKPENVMRTTDGRWKILDFGLARIERGAQAPGVASIATVPGMLIGTPAYMAPEQLNGEPAGPAADVFALGVLIYEWATGVHPFAASTPLALVAHILNSDAAPIAARVPQLPSVVAATIDRCLAKSPFVRFASAAELVSALSASEIVPGGSSNVSWWRLHQLASMALYIAGTTVAWHAKETLVPGPLSLALFLAAAVGSAFNGIIRGHLIFTEYMNRPRFAYERRRTARLVTRIDLAIAALLFATGLLVAPKRALWSLMIFTLALGIGLAAALMEPATTAAAFGDASAGETVDRN